VKNHRRTGPGERPQHPILPGWSLGFFRRAGHTASITVMLIVLAHPIADASSTDRNSVTIPLVVPDAVFSVTRDAVSAPLWTHWPLPPICLLPIGPLPPIICLPPPPCPPETSPPSPPPTPPPSTSVTSVQPTSTQQGTTAPAQVPTLPTPQRIVVRQQPAPSESTTPVTGTPTPPTTTAAPTAPGTSAVTPWGTAVLPPNTALATSSGNPGVVERRWALAVVLFVFLGGASAARSAMRRRSR
jgi:hypothetical protein